MFLIFRANTPLLPLWCSRMASRKERVQTVQIESGTARRLRSYKGSCKKTVQQHPLPNLLFVDGGRGQVNAALEALKDLGKACPVVGLAKKEEIIVTEDKDIVLPQDHPVLRLLIQVRDETHRFAVNYHRRRREKESLRSVLDEIPGVGPIRKRSFLSTLVP